MSRSKAQPVAAKPPGAAPERLTFVGVGPCGHAGYVAQDPATYEPELLKNCDMLDEYESLVDALRYYARNGHVKLVTDGQLAPYIDQMGCKCRKKAGL